MNTQNVQKTELLCWPAGRIIYVIIVESLMCYSEIALSALHLKESDTAIQSKAVVVDKIHKIRLNVAVAIFLLDSCNRYLLLKHNLCVQFVLCMSL